MRGKFIFLTLCAVVLAHCSFAEAQQPTKVARLGFLIATSPSTEKARIDSFLQGMRELGYVEGKNLVIEWRYAEGQFDRLPALAAELARLKVEVIVTAGPTVTRAAKQATSKIPLVMAQDADPVGSGLVSSLARPGGNITGLSTFSAELSAKRLELLKESIPKLSRVAVLGVSPGQSNAQWLRLEVDRAARAFGVTLQYLEVLVPRISRLHSEPLSKTMLTLSSAGEPCC